MEFAFLCFVLICLFSLQDAILPSWRAKRFVHSNHLKNSRNKLKIWTTKKNDFGTGASNLIPNKELESNKLSAEDWINKTFHLPALPLYEIKALEGNACIISRPKISMANPYLGSNIDVCMSKLEKTLKEPPDSRFKPVLVTVRGVGGGKSRLVEEMRRRKNKNKNSVAVAITYNSNVQYNFKVEQFIKTEEYLAVNMILSVMVRIASVVFGGSTKFWRDIVNGESKDLDVYGLTDSESIAAFFRLFIQHVILNIEKVYDKATDYGDNRLENLVFMIDEFMKVPEDESLLIKYSQESINAAFKDFKSALNQAILNEEFACSNGPVLNTALVISSLELSAVDVTDSGRLVEVLRGPNNLNSTSIVYDWWLLENASCVIAASKNDLFQLDLIAKTINNLPRLVEFAGRYLDRTDIPSLLNENKNIMTRERVSGLYADLFDSMVSLYPKSTKASVDFHKLFALVYGYEVLLDNNTMRMIRCSIITNSLERIDATYTFIPSASVILLARLSDIRLDDVDPVINRLDPFHCCYLLFRSAIEMIVSARESGKALEVFTLTWLQVRLAAATQIGMSSISVNELFSLSLKKNISPPNITISAEDVNYFQGIEQLPAMLNTRSSNAYAKAFNDMDIPDEPFLLYESVDGQSYDQMIIYKIPDSKDDDVFVLFIDEKSTRIQSTDNSTDFNDIRQYDSIVRVVNQLKMMQEDEKVELSPVSQALVRGNFRYIYLTTKEKVSINKILKTKPNVIVALKEDAKKFFGIMWDFYQAAASSAFESKEKTN